MILRRPARMALACVLTACAALGAAFLYYRHVQHRGSGEAEKLLEQADEFAWNDQWVPAEPLYSRAQAMFLQKGDASRALYAEVSRTIPHVESSSLHDTIVRLTQDLAAPAAQDPETRLRILTILGRVEIDYDAGLARSTWAEVRKLAEHQGHFLLASRAMGEHGIAAFMLGDTTTAKNEVRAAWGASEISHDDAAHVRYASSYGAGLAQLHRYKEALIPLDEAINTAAKNPNLGYPHIAVLSKIDVLNGLHRYQEALTLANTAMARIPDQYIQGQFFQARLSRGEVYYEMHNFPAAIADYTQALHNAQQIGFWRGIMAAGTDLARTYKDQGKLQDALAAVNAAIDANKKNPDELFLIPRSLGLKAEILERLGRNREADAMYEKSAALIDSMLANVPTENVERILLSELSEVYSGHFEALAEQKAYAEALSVLEQARGRIESQRLLHHEFVSPHPPTKEELQLTQLNLALIDTNDPEERALLMRRIYTTELSIDTSSLEGATAMRPIPLAKLQKILTPEEVLLEYVLGSPHSSVLAITQNTARVYQLPERDTIESDSTHYRDILRAQKSDNGIAARLYDSLLAPIKELDAKTNVIIVPDGALHLLPFEALVRNGKYIVESKTISVVPSSTVLAILTSRREGGRDESLPYVGVAAWIKKKKTENPILRAISGPQRDEFIPLPESALEVETIATDLPRPSTLLLGTDATETHFKQLPLEKYRVLHLALHGYVDADYPDRSALVFAPEPHGADDGLLQVREIRKLHLNASLVALSACNTGVGPVGEDGVANLVNAFIEAGASSVVSTLWELDDRSTELLMTNFYHNLSQNQTKAVALRHAQLQLIGKHLPPYYWASFELVGEPAGTIDER